MKKTYCISFFLFFSFLVAVTAQSQMITGVWKGRIGKQKAEIKIIQNGDSLTGTSYYYESAGTYRRYSIKGYFDPYSNAVVWWDDRLIEEKTGRISFGAPGKVPLLSRADFNCPGGGVMMLDGKTGPKEDPAPEAVLHLNKTDHTTFEDEWNFVLDNYIVGANHPRIIDSVGLIAFADPAPQKTIAPQDPVTQQPLPERETPMLPPAPVEEKAVPTVPQTIEEKFIVRKSKYVMDIPLSGDSIELRFYDNAEIDGDSISLFLNEQLIFRHIRLTGKSYVVKLAVADLKDSNELIMVAENLGRIPPNTSYMVALAGGRRYEANLESTEQTSAMIRLIKPKSQ